MARFDTKEVNELWALHIDEAGRKIKGLKIDGRWTEVYESNLKNDDGLYPIRSRYLLNWCLSEMPESENLSDMVLTGTWITKKQYKVLLKEAGKQWRKGGIEHLIQIIAKLFDNLGDKLSDMVEGNIIELIVKAAVGKINSEVLTEENIRGLLTMIIR